MADDSNNTIGGLSRSELAQICDQAVADLQSLLRIPSVNPPGGELPAITLLEGRLEDAGLAYERFDLDGRPNLVSRLSGDGTGGGPLLLTGHVDVVPVEREHWDHDPFAGEIHDGYLFGRGAIDMKNMVTMCLHVISMAKRSGLTPTRDIIFAAVSDEEQGCTYGSRFLVEEHPETVRADYMIGEVGGFPLDVNGVRYYPIQVAEKGIARIRVTTIGRPGHGSMPHDEMAVSRLGEVLGRLARARLPQHNTPTMERFVRGLAETQRGAARLILPLLLRPSMSGFVIKRLLPDRSSAETFAANLSNTVSPTMLSGSEAVNVIPGTASVLLDGRLIPGQTAEDLVRELREILPPDVRIDVESWAPGRADDGDDDPLLEAIFENVRRHDPDGVPLPYMIPGFTDAAYFGRLGARCYGYSPLRFPRDDGVVFKDLFHGHNERIHVEGFRWGLVCLWDLVSRFVGLSS